MTSKFNCRLRKNGDKPKYFLHLKVVLHATKAKRIDNAGEELLAHCDKYRQRLSIAGRSVKAVIFHM